MGANAKIETLADCGRHGANVGARCRCGRVMTFETAQIVRYFQVRRWDLRVEQAKNRFKCKECGRRGWVTLGLSYNAPDASIGPRDEQGWARLVRRLRD